MQQYTSKGGVRRAPGSAGTNMPSTCVVEPNQASPHRHRQTSQRIVAKHEADTSRQVFVIRFKRKPLRDNKCCTMACKCSPDENVDRGNLGTTGPISDQVRLVARSANAFGSTQSHAHLVDVKLFFLSSKLWGLDPLPSLGTRRVALLPLGAAPEFRTREKYETLAALFGRARKRGEKRQRDATLWICRAHRHGADAARNELGCQGEFVGRCGCQMLQEKPNSESCSSGVVDPRPCARF